MPLDTPGCRTLGTYENAKISYCWDDEGPHGPGGVPEKGWCVTMRELVEVFITRAFRRGLSGGFVKVVESEGGKWVNSTVSETAIGGDRRGVRGGSGIGADYENRS